jgi:predicted short-subunit dehydrogenase-like oxidoreductase (DUF2520 family)
VEKTGTRLGAGSTKGWIALIDAARIIGPGRAGQSLAVALEGAGWDIDLLDRRAPLAPAARGCPLLVIATPDAVVAEVAAAVDPSVDTVVAHVAGSLGLGVLAPHTRRASVHPLVAMPDPDTGSRRLLGAWFAVAGDPRVGDVVDALGGHAVGVADDRRATYHAAAVVASNHLVALLGQAERLAADAGVPFEALLDLVRSTVDNVAELGPAAALTGPVARGDWETVDAHLEALAPDERVAYDILANEARKLTFPPAAATGNRDAGARESEEAAT